MKEIKSVFAGEMSGHIFFGDSYYGFDDAIYASIRFLTYLHIGTCVSIKIERVNKHKLAKVGVGGQTKNPQNGWLKYMGGPG